jgi:hypothetical protein
MRMRVLPLLLALVLGVTTAYVVSCGGDRSNLIPQSNASDLNSALDQVASATKSGDCSKAGQALSRAQGVLVNLPSSVDTRLRQRLQDGLASLRQHVPSQCQQTSSTQATTTQAPATTATQTTQTQTTQTETTQTETTQTDTGTTSTETAPQTTTTTNTTGGAGG